MAAAAAAEEEPGCPPRVSTPFFLRPRSDALLDAVRLRR
jgi:hypothetical protein